MQISPYQHEIESLYTRVQSGNMRSIVITSSTAREGVSSIAQALAHRLLLAGESTLLVDLNIFNPSTQSLLDVERPDSSLGQPEMLTTMDTELVLMGVHADNRKSVVNELRQPCFLKNKMHEWSQEFEYIVVDAPPLTGAESEGVQAEHLAAVCDATIMVVLACRTPDRVLSEAMRKLDSESVNLLGCILNDHYNPPLRLELLRELERCPKALVRLKTWISGYVSKSHFLAMEL